MDRATLYGSAATLCEAQRITRHFAVNVGPLIAISIEALEGQNVREICLSCPTTLRLIHVRNFGWVLKHRIPIPNIEATCYTRAVPTSEPNMPWGQHLGQSGVMGVTSLQISVPLSYGSLKVVPRPLLHPSSNGARAWKIRLSARWPKL